MVLLGASETMNKNKKNFLNQMKNISIRCVCEYIYIYIDRERERWNPVNHYYQ